MIPIEVLQLISFLQSAFNEMQLKDEIALTSEEIARFKKEYPLIRFSPKKRKFSANNTQEYLKFSSKILDFYVFNTLDTLFDLLVTNQSNRLSLITEMVGAFNKAGFFSVGRYLGESTMPTFINDERLYKKMLWMEWTLSKLLSCVNNNILPDMRIPLIGGTKSAIATRLTATKKFIDHYIELNPAARKKAEEFRETYNIRNITNSYLNALPVLKTLDIKIIEDKPVKLRIDRKPELPKIEKREEPVIVIEEIKEPKVANLSPPIPTVKLDSNEQQTLTLLKIAVCEYENYLVNIEENNLSSEEITTKLRVVRQLMIVERLDDFKFLFKATKQHLEKSRDTGTVKFLKTVATVLTAGLAALFGIWSVRGKSVTNNMERILKNKKLGSVYNSLG